MQQDFTAASASLAQTAHQGCPQKLPGPENFSGADRRLIRPCILPTGHDSAASPRSGAVALTTEIARSRPPLYDRQKTKLLRSQTEGPYTQKGMYCRNLTDKASELLARGAMWPRLRIRCLQHISCVDAVSLHASSPQHCAMRIPRRFARPPEPNATPCRPTGYSANGSAYCTGEPSSRRGYPQSSST